MLGSALWVFIRYNIAARTNIRGNMIVGTFSAGPSFSEMMLIQMEYTMSAMDAANAYFEAWNARDADAIIASLAEAGTYQDPITRGPLSGAALKEYVESLWAAFPDLNFEIKSAAEAGDGRIAAEWIMRGTNQGPFHGLPPTGKSIQTPGADFIETANGKVTSVTGYFDGGEVPRQLGLQIIVQPHEIGPFRFGNSAAVSTGIAEPPGAYSITQIEALNEDTAEENRELARRMLQEMMGMAGFIGAVVARVGMRQMTISAWTDAEAPARFMNQGTHAEAMKTFFTGELAESGYTSVWSPVRKSAYWVRCRACGAMNDPDISEGKCKCGAALPEHPPYW